jgi:hypothetical protein
MGLRLKKVGNEVMIVLGGREIHPVNVRLGGFYRLPRLAELRALREPLLRARDAALATTTWVAGFEFPDVEPERVFMALSHPDEYAINAAALTALSSAGIHDRNLSDPVLNFLDRSYGGISDYYREHYYFWYGNYYAAQAFYQHGGARLRSFYERLSKDLLDSQRADGSWENRVGPGDEFATAVACVLLQMPKQYLPIFQR